MHVIMVIRVRRIPMVVSLVLFVISVLIVHRVITFRVIIAVIAMV